MGTFSLNVETYENLTKLSEKYKVKKSALVRLFITHFNKEREQLEKLIKENVKK